MRNKIGQNIYPLSSKMLQIIESISQLPMAKSDENNNHDRIEAVWDMDHK